MASRGTTPQAMVQEFMEVFGHPVLLNPQPLPGDRKQLRVALIEEELAEYCAALEDDDVIAQADALADLTYVIYGAALESGIDLDSVIAEVHGSNMSKLGGDGRPIYRETDGKVLKGPQYRPPQVASVLFPQ